jgi:hypothetical protein
MLAAKWGAVIAAGFVLCKSSSGEDDENVEELHFE